MDFFSQFLNLSKLAAVTVPGLVAAFAMTLLIYPPPCSPVDPSGKCWYCAGVQNTPEITPSSGRQGESLAVTIAANGSTNWDDHTIAAFDLSTWQRIKDWFSSQAAQPEIKADDLHLLGSTQILAANFVIQPDATAGPHTLVITTGGSEVRAAFQVDPRYTLTISPSSGDPGQSVVVKIASVNSNPPWGANPTIQKIKDIDVSDQKPPAAGQIQATFKIGAKAAPGARTVTIGNLSGKFTVNSTDDYGRITVSCVTWGSETGRTKPSCDAPPDQTSQAKSPVAIDLEKLLSPPPSAAAAQPYTFDLAKCEAVPAYVVKGSRNTKKSDDSKKSNISAKSDSRFPGETTADPGTVLATLDSCNVALQSASAGYDTANSSLQTQITGLSSQLTSVLAAQEKAAESGNRLLADSYTPRVQQLKGQIAALQSQSQWFTSGKAIAANLMAQLTALRSDTAAQVNQAPAPEAAPAKNTFQSTIQNILGNIFAFLAASLALGLILDPLQRLFVSGAPRAWAFKRFNRRTAQGTGEMRFGDHRYADAHTHDRSERLLEQDPHIYDPNYAIGRGLLTQSEYTSLYDEYVRQSQLVTGMLIPVLMLAVAIWLRLDCCGSPSAWPKFLIVIATLLLLPTLWYAGLDRLHKFYSEVQARIAGHFKKLELAQKEKQHAMQATDQGKLLDILSDPKSRMEFVDEFEKRRESYDRLDRIIREIGHVGTPGDDTTRGPGGAD